MSSSDGERNLARGVRESIEYMSGGRSPKPRNTTWVLICIGGYIGLFAMLASAIYYGSRMPIP